MRREDIIWLGVVASVLGALTGGMALAIGMILLQGGAQGGWLLVLLGAPLAGGLGYLLGRRLASRLP